MPVEPSGPVTQLLHAAGRGDAAAVSRLWSTVYDELRRLAQGQLNREGPVCSMQTTSLVNEAYLRLVGDGHIDWSNRRHFFGAAAEAMRRILVDDARRRRGLKHGGGRKREPLLEDPSALGEDPALTLAVDQAVQKLKAADRRKYEVVLLRYFSGLSVDETAAALEVSPRTVDSEWRFAKAWLHRELSKGDTAAS